MINFLADENFDFHIVRAFRKALPTCDIVRVQDVQLDGESDPVVLDWSARNHRAVLSHDTRTLIRYARERISSKLPMAGLFIVGRVYNLREIVDDLVLIDQCSEMADWAGHIGFLPFRSIA